MNIKKVLKKINKNQKKLQARALKKLIKQQNKRQSKILKSIEKNNKQLSAMKKTLKKAVENNSSQVLSEKNIAHQLKIVSPPSPCLNPTPLISKKTQNEHAIQKKIVPILNMKSLSKKIIKQNKIQKTLRLPLKSHPCRRCPALTNGICKCAAKKYG